jgi:DNA modification methylase
MYSLSELFDVIDNRQPFALVKGDANILLDSFPENSVDCVITSPPYWNLREYTISTQNDETAIGLEDTLEEYLTKVCRIFSKIKRVLKPSGSLWLNIGDKYCNKRLIGLPWRVALGLQGQGWILRNEVIWNQIKGSISCKDRLRMNRESLFHFVKQQKYYYNWQDILVKPTKQASLKDGKVVSATGVSGIKYRQQIEHSSALTAKEKSEALHALENTLDGIREGKLIDFRMTIRGQQRILHGNSTRLSGRAKELKEKGFYIIQSQAIGHMPTDIWNIVPEDEWRTDTHCAVFPIELLETPIKATCPKDGILLDPFVGTGSTVVAGVKFGCRAIGIDVSIEYLALARQRVLNTQRQLS